MAASSSPRVLGHYERFCVARANVGQPPIPVYIALLDAPIARERLEAAVKVLLARYPLLSCCILEPTKPSLRWATNPDVKAEDVVEILHGSPPELSVLLSNPATMNMATGPLWRIQLYDSVSPTLVLHVHHAVSDGVGSRNLLVELLQHVANPIPHIEVEPTPFPPTLEATVDVRPTWPHLLRTIYKSLLLPRLPSLLRNWMAPRAVWPNPPRIPGLGRPPRIALIRVAPSSVLMIKETAKRHNVRTLHPVLLAIGLHAIWVVAGRGEEVLSSFSSPASERDSKLGHPTSTGNFVSGHERAFTLSPRQSFWALAREVAAELASPARRAIARGRMGMLAYIPKPDVINDRGQTGWEEFLENGLVNNTHFNYTFSMSNIGLVPPCPGVKEIVWTQRLTPGNGNEPISMNVVTTTDGPMYIAINWQDGVLDDAEIEVFRTTYEHLVEVIAAQGVADTAVFNDLLADKS